MHIPVIIGLFLLGLLAGSWLTRIAYPLPGKTVEIATGILWAAEGWRLAGMHSLSLPVILGIAVAELAFLSAMVVVILIDWKYLVIPDAISLGGMAAGLLFSLALPPLQGYWSDHWRSLFDSLAGMAGGILAMLVLYYLGKILFKAKIQQAQEKDPEIDSALGMGDVKLMGCFGAFFGLYALVPIFLIAVFSASFVGVNLKMASGDPGDTKGLAAWRNRWHSGDSCFPFGPFLALGAIVMLYLR